MYANQSNLFQALHPPFLDYLSTCARYPFQAKREILLVISITKKPPSFKVLELSRWDLFFLAIFIKNGLLGEFKRKMKRNKLNDLLEMVRPFFAGIASTSVLGDASVHHYVVADFPPVLQQHILVNTCVDHHTVYRLKLSWI